MALLPRSNQEFTDPIYWQKFFKQCDAPFEWYGDFNQLGSSFERYLKSTDRILQIGCGNSILADQLHDAGYRSITSIDTDQSVIERQRSRSAAANRQLQFEVCSAAKLPFPDENFSVVIDKGTLDALLPPAFDLSAKETVEQMFAEVFRVLAIGGRYIIVSLLQEHILRFYLNHFNERRNCMIRIHRCESTDDGFVMPVFLLIATKLRSQLPQSLPMILEYQANHQQKPERIKSIDQMTSMVTAEQEYAWFCHQCSQTLPTEMGITISDASSRPRYHIFVVDDLDVKTVYTYSVFIVPIGRDADWLFATTKGRRCLRRQCDRHRLAIVRLFRNQDYGSLDDIKDELAGVAKSFAPAKAFGQKIEFLSLGEVDVKETLATGRSKLSGEWAVENVKIRDEKYRRLVFLSSQNLVQSEARLLKRVKKGKSPVVDLDFLSCDHHQAMLSVLAFLNVQNSKPSSDFTLEKVVDLPLMVAVLGLGGGALTAFVYRHLPKVTVIGVELDPEVVKIARNWFAFPKDDERLTVKIVDALDFLNEASLTGNGNRFDVILVDISGPTHDNGLSCPPAVFVTPGCLSNMYAALSDYGVLALNLVTRDEEISAQVKSEIAKVFPTILVHCSEDEVNEVLICLKWEAPIAAIEMIKASAKQLKQKNNGWMNDLVDNIQKLQLSGLR